MEMVTLKQIKETPTKYIGQKITFRGYPMLDNDLGILQKLYFEELSKVPEVEWTEHDISILNRELSWEWIEDFIFKYGKGLGIELLKNEESPYHRIIFQDKINVAVPKANMNLFFEKYKAMSILVAFLILNNIHRYYGTMISDDMIYIDLFSDHLKGIILKNSNFEIKFYQTIKTFEQFEQIIAKLNAGSFSVKNGGYAKIFVSTYNNEFDYDIKIFDFDNDFIFSFITPSVKFDPDFISTFLDF